jgi:hypothetical protein
LFLLKPIFRKLDEWVIEQNREAQIESFRPIKACTFRVVGQTALLEASIDLEIAATADVDAFNDAEFSVVAKLNELLLSEGLQYDQLSNEIWMPAETLYTDIFRGTWVTALLAQVEFVMLSKAKMAPTKNRILLRNYVASEPPVSFFALCRKYKVDLTSILRD